MPRAVGLTDELLSGWANILSVVDLVPSSKGRFEVMVDDDLIFSKISLGRHAHPGEIASLIRDRIGPEVRSSD